MKKYLKSIFCNINIIIKNYIFFGLPILVLCGLYESTKTHLDEKVQEVTDSASLLATQTDPVTEKVLIGLVLFTLILATILFIKTGREK